jgi:F-type H+-transporting ATPase subunit a
MNFKVALFALLAAATPAVAGAQQAAPAPADAQAPHVATPPAAAPEALEHTQATQVDPAAGEAHGAAAEAHGAEHGEAEGHGEFDPMHHIQDGQTLDFLPLGQVKLPPKGSWMVGPIDMTPTRHVVFMALAGFLVLAIFIPAGLAARRRASSESPGGKRHNVVEGFALYIRDEVIVPNIGHGGEKYAAFLLTVFFFILFMNLLGQLPWGATATANIAVTAALATIVFVVVEVSGMVAQGPHYLGTIFYWNKELPLPMRVVMFLIMSPVELLGKLAKPFALAVRLMANMMAGHIVLLALFGVALAFGSIGIAVGPFLMALMLTFLELFVAFLQAYVFVVLSSVFIGLIRHAH